MSRYLRSNAFTIFAVLALVIAATVSSVDAQTEDPILDDEDIFFSITVGDTHYAMPVALQAAAESFLGTTGQILTVSEFVNNLLPATSTSVLRFEGCFPSASVAMDLDALGYWHEVPLAPAIIPGASFGVERTN